MRAGGSDKWRYMVMISMRCGRHDVGQSYRAPHAVDILLRIARGSQVDREAPARRRLREIMHDKPFMWPTMTRQTSRMRVCFRRARHAASARRRGQAAIALARLHFPWSTAGGGDGGAARLSSPICRTTLESAGSFVLDRCLLGAQRRAIVVRSGMLVGADGRAMCRRPRSDDG